MYEPFETYRHAGFTVELYSDYDAGNPYREWDQASEILSDVRDYDLGGDVPHPESWYRETPSSAVMSRYLTLFGGYALAIPWTFQDYGSGGVRVWLTTPDEDRASGYLVMTYEAAAEFDSLEQAEACARAEFDNFRTWIEGEVIGYVVKADNGDVIDSCWGFYGELDYVKTEANQAAEYEASERARLRQLPWLPTFGKLEKDRLEYLRGELRAERISYGELAELQGLVEFIEPGDIELLEAAGVPEFEES